MSLARSQLDEYADLGYTVALDLFRRDEIEAMQLELERLHREGRFWDVSLQPAAEATAPNLHLGGPSQQSRLFQALIFAPNLTETARELVGDPLVFQQDQILLKPARTGRGTGWHQDNAYFGHPDPISGVGIWIALHPATRANGTMHVIPRSHRAVVAHRLAEGTAYLKQAPEVDESEAVAIELPPGGALLFNNGVMHCTKDNLSEHPRAAISLHYVNGERVRIVHGGSSSAIRITGPEAIGGLAECGRRIEGTWSSEVREVIRVARGVAC